MDKASVKTSDAVRTVLRELNEIPGISPDIERGLKRIDEQLRKGEISFETATERVLEYKATIRKARREAEPYIHSLRKLEAATEDPAEGFARAKEKLSSFLDFMTDFDPTSFRRLLVKGIAAGTVGLVKVTGKATKTMGKLFRRATEDVDLTAEAIEGLGIDPETARRFSAFSKKFRKDIATPAKGLAKFYTPVRSFFARFFGSRRERATAQRDLAKLWGAFKGLGKIDPPEGIQAIEDAPKELVDRIEAVSNEIRAENEGLWKSVDVSAMEGTKDIPKHAEIAWNSIVEGAEKAEKKVKKVEPMAKMGDSLEAFVDTLRDKITPDLATELGGLVNVFRRGAQDASEEMGGLADNVSQRMTRLRTDMVMAFDAVGNSIQGAFDKGTGAADKFGQHFDTYVEERLGDNVEHIHQLFKGLGGILKPVQDDFDAGFEKILEKKKVFDQKVLENLQGLSGKVKGAVSGMSGAMGTEFVEAANKADAPLKRLADDMSRVHSGLGSIQSGFAGFHGWTSANAESLFEDLSLIGQGLKKATGQNPFPVLGLLAKIGPSLARFASVAARAGPKVSRFVTGADKAKAAVEAPLKSAVRAVAEKGKEKVIAKGKAFLKARAAKLLPERRKAGEESRDRAPAQAGMDSSAIVGAIGSMSKSMGSKLGGVSAAVGRSRAQRLSGTLKVDSDEMGRAVSASTRTTQGLRGSVR